MIEPLGKKFGLTPDEVIDGSQLAALMIRNNVGVRTAETLHVKNVDENFFDIDWSE